MKKRLWMMRLISFMVVFTMAFGACVITDHPVKYVTNAAYAEEGEVTEEAPEAVAEPAPEPEPEPQPEPEPEPQPEPEPEPQPEEPSDTTVVTEVENQENTTIEEEPELDWDDEDFEDDGEDFGDDEFMEFDDDDPGDVSSELLQQFNNPDNYRQVEFSGSADIELKDEAGMWTAEWDGEVTLTAKVKEANLSYRLIWEANDHDDRGWFTVGSGDEYSYTLTRDNAEREAKREYRVVLLTVD